MNVNRNLVRTCEYDVLAVLLGVKCEFRAAEPAIHVAAPRPTAAEARGRAKFPKLSFQSSAGTATSESGKIAPVSICKSSRPEFASQIQRPSGAIRTGSARFACNQPRARSVACPRTCCPGIHVAANRKGERSLPAGPTTLLRTRPLGGDSAMGGNKLLSSSSRNGRAVVPYHAPDGRQHRYPSAGPLTMVAGSQFPPEPVHRCELAAGV